MLALLDTHGPYRLPTSWHEVTTRQYCDLDRLQLATVEARASYFAGRPIQVNGLVADVLAFLLHPVPNDEHFKSYPSDLGQVSYLQVETIRGLLANKPLNECFAEVCATFVAEHNPNAFYKPDSWQARVVVMVPHYEAWPITDTYPSVAHCLAELQRLNETFAALNEPDHTEAGRRAREAGSDRLAIFSHLNVARHYAERFSTTIDAVYQWPWQQVALFLLQDRIQAEIQDNLQKASE